MKLSRKTFQEKNAGRLHEQLNCQGKVGKKITDVKGKLFKKKLLIAFTSSELKKPNCQRKLVNEKYIVNLRNFSRKNG